MKRIFWNYRKSILGRTHDFLAPSDQFNCPYIIRLGMNGACHVYDIRKYSDMSRIDYGYFGYSIISSHLSQSAAKAKIRRLMRKELTK